MTELFSLETVIPIAVSVNTVVSVIQGIVMAAYRKHQADYKGLEDKLKYDYKELDERIEKKCDKMAQIEMELQRVPTQNEILRLYDRIDQINKDIRALGIGQGEILGQLKGITYGRRKTDD